MDKKQIRALQRAKRKKDRSIKFQSWIMSFFGKRALLGVHGYLNGSFKDYLLQEDFPQRVADLKRGLDAESLRQLDLILQRIVRDPEFIPAGHNNHVTLVSPDSYLTEREKEQGREFLRQLPTLRKKYKLPIPAHIYDVFVARDGLTLLPKNILEYMRDKAFIDGGAYIGDSLLSLLEYGPSKVCSFEISEENVYYYKETARMNSIPADKFELLQKGLGERTETISFGHNGGLGGNIFVEGTNELPLVSIDDFVRERDLRVGLIKLDVEGVESGVVRGALETIREQRPVLCISIYHNPRDFFEIKPFLESLRLGYQFMIRKLGPAMIPNMPFSHECWYKRHALSIEETKLLAWPEG